MDSEEYFLIRGIRHNGSFAKSPKVTKLCSEKQRDRLARARNARLIMSNTIPDISSEAVKPYCIWYPDTATEETYRALASRYPDMRYHVGRACAVAGYKTLYDELDLLPDVSIAEEARDNGHDDIFETITSQPARYAVMNDYTRTVNLESPTVVVGLNGDTAVRSSLQNGPPYSSGFPISYFNEDLPYSYPDAYFDIQEDLHVGHTGWPRPDGAALESQYAYLAHTPLPRDLPPINKDVLILLAAWDGNFERYSRLRRPVLIRNELTAVIRGAYHHTPFARWLETCADEIFPGFCEDIMQAVHARFIMNNDLSRIDSDTDGDTLPSFFWWPHCPQERTLRELAWRRTDLKHQVTLACIVGNFYKLFDELLATMKPTQLQWELAIQSPISYFRKQLMRRAEQEGDVEFEGDESDLKGYWENPWPSEDAWSRKYLRPDKEMYVDGGTYDISKADISNELGNYHVDDRDYVCFSPPPDHDLLSKGMHRQISRWHRIISTTDKTRQEAAKNERPSVVYPYFGKPDRYKTPAPEPKYPKDFTYEEEEED
nr:uncharacterized protein CTRU02_14883 [Colletotrichum truncatum]KAF6781684.1 hypothetical protein CTRU02_14883 [Colletotrichum truncatum]